MTTFAERFKDEGRIEGRDEGRREYAQDMLLDALMAKFHFVPQEIKDKLFTLKEPPKLKDLHRHAILSNDIREFQDKLNRIAG
jgi:hypothetical protein